VTFQAAKFMLVACSAFAIACAEMCLRLGATHDQITLVDSLGVIYDRRANGMNPYKRRFARHATSRTLADALVGADVFIGVSADQVTGGMLRSMGKAPIV
jgi:malate dehydrogenase (oxaloacetate-decarboxylating)(NADP+)